MHSPLSLIPALIGLSFSLSIPLYPSTLQQTSNTSIPIISINNVTTPELSAWPSPPFRVHVHENMYLLIDAYMPAAEHIQKGAALASINAMEEAIEKEKDPWGYIDNRRVFNSGVVSARFPALAIGDPPKVTNQQAIQVLGAVWTLEYVYGTRGFAYATVEIGTTALCFFSLWITPPAAALG